VTTPSTNPNTPREYLERFQPISESYKFLTWKDFLPPRGGVGIMGEYIELYINRGGRGKEYGWFNSFEELLGFPLIYMHLNESKLFNFNFF